MLILLITIAFVSYKWNDLGVLLVSFIVLLGYEYLRFFKVVDAAKVGYLREIIFGLLIIIVSFIIFRKTSFGRSQ
jgi:fucose permease